MNKSQHKPLFGQYKKPKKPHKTVKNSTKCSHEEDFDVQYWSDGEVNELISSYVSKQYTERNYDDFDF